MTTSHMRSGYPEPVWQDEAPRLAAPAPLTTVPTGPVEPQPPEGLIQLGFRAGRRRRTLHLGLAGICLVLSGAFAVAGTGPYLSLLCLVIAGFQALAAGVTPRFGVILTQWGITLRGWRTRHHPWPDVVAVEAVNFLWARRVHVRLAGGSTIRTWAPYDDFILTDLKFEPKVQALQQWHARHRHQGV